MKNNNDNATESFEDNQANQISEFLSDSFGDTKDEEHMEEEDKSDTTEEREEENQEIEDTEDTEREESDVAEEEDISGESGDVEPEPEPEPIPEPELIPDEASELKEQNKLLLEKIESLSKGLRETPIKQEATPDVKTVIDEELTEDFLDELDIDDVTSNKELLNQVLLKVAAKIEERVEKKYNKNISSDIKQYTDNHIEMKELVDSFYKENLELIGVKSTVQAVAVDVIKNNPDMKLIDVFKTAADDTRKMLGIKKRTVEVSGQAVKKKNNPALVKKTQSASKAKKKDTGKSKLQNDIDNLL